MLFPSATPVQLSDTFPVYDHFLALCVLHDEIRLASTIEPFVIHREFRAVGAESHVEELLVDGLRLEELRGVGGLNHKVVDQALLGRDKKMPAPQPTITSIEEAGVQGVYRTRAGILFISTRSQ